jgi:hypothetical protein
MTPALVIEFEAMGYHTLEDLQQIGWEKLCLAFSKIHPTRFNPQFFNLLYAITHNIPVAKVTKKKKRIIEKLYKKIKAGDEAGFAKKSKKNSAPN